MKYSNTAQLPRVRALPFFFRLGPHVQTHSFPRGIWREGGGGGGTRSAQHFFKPSLKQQCFLSILKIDRLEVKK